MAMMPDPSRFRQRFDELGLEPVGSQSEAFAKFIVKASRKCANSRARSGSQ